jgi:uncharacterized membrane protein
MISFPFRIFPDRMFRVDVVVWSIKSKMLTIYVEFCSIFGKSVKTAKTHFSKNNTFSILILNKVPKVYFYKHVIEVFDEVVGITYYFFNNKRISEHLIKYF